MGLVPINLEMYVLSQLGSRFEITEGQQQSKMASKISRSQDFIEISGFLWDFNLWISGFYGIYGISMGPILQK